MASTTTQLWTPLPPTVRAFHTVGCWLHGAQLMPFRRAASRMLRTSSEYESVDAALDQEHNRLLAANDDLMTQVATLRRRVPAMVVERWRAEAHAVAGTPDHRSTAIYPPTVQEALTTPITSLNGL